MDEEYLRYCELLSHFYKLVYSNCETEFYSQKTLFINSSEGVMIEFNKKVQPLVDYYMKNWHSIKDMWVKAYRIHLPRLGDNTSNRVERYFLSLKKSIEDTFLSLPNTITAAVHLVKYVDRRLEEKYAFVTNKSTVIYDSNPSILSLNSEASMILNDRGCTLFHIAQKNLDEIKEKLEEVDGGVNLKLAQGDKFYTATINSCSCTFYRDHQCPCLHILFLRMIRLNSSVISADLFHP